MWIPRTRSVRGTRPGTTYSSAAGSCQFSEADPLARQTPTINDTMFTVVGNAVASQQYENDFSNLLKEFSEQLESEVGSNQG